MAAFDVDAKKVGFDLSDAINNSENNTIRICDVPPTGVTVQRGPTLDGLGKYYLETIDQADAEPVDVVQVLKESRADVLVSYLPVGSEQADKFYAQCAIDAGVAFVNALPVFIASDPVWAKKFEDAGVPIIGDDIKSQVGATITHRVMAKLFEDRGVVLDRTYQLNVGGNMDFKNMLERDRLESKKVSKTQAVTSNMNHDMGARNVHIGPVGLRAVARRPQVGLRAPRGSRVRRRPAEPGVQARGVGLPQLGRHHHRRDPCGEDRQGPRHRWPDPVGLVVPDEEPAGAAPRRRGPHLRRGVHQGRRRALSVLFGTNSVAARRKGLTERVIDNGPPGSYCLKHERRHTTSPSSREPLRRGRPGASAGGRRLRRAAATSAPGWVRRTGPAAAGRVRGSSAPTAAAAAGPQAG